MYVPYIITDAHISRSLLIESTAVVDDENPIAPNKLEQQVCTSCVRAVCVPLTIVISPASSSSVHCICGIHAHMHKFKCVRYLCVWRLLLPTSLRSRCSIVRVYTWVFVSEESIRIHAYI